MQGFFAGSTLMQQRQAPPIVTYCGACRLQEQCLSPKLPVFGEGGKGILFVGSSPSKEADALGQAVGKTSLNYLQDVLHEVGVHFQRDCWYTNALICRPRKMPSTKYVDYCRASVFNTIKRLKPKVIVTWGLGTISLTGHYYGNYGPDAVWHNWHIPLHDIDAWLCPTLPMIYARSSRRESDAKQTWFKRNVQAACLLRKRPSEDEHVRSIPQWIRNGETIPPKTKIGPSTDDFHRFVHKIMDCEVATAFDYETTGIKPERNEQRLCSIAIASQSLGTYATHVDASNLGIIRDYLRCRSPKIASNLYFEDRWSRRKVGTAVRNWCWDTMQAAHVLDSRRGIAGLKFQAFVRMGYRPYDDHIEPFLDSGNKNGNSLNRIDEIEKTSLLKYNAIDAVIELELAITQMKEFGVYDQYRF